jgi:hypothetical protein
MKNKIIVAAFLYTVFAFTVIVIGILAGSGII